MTRLDADAEAQARIAAFKFLEALTAKHGDDLPWAELAAGFDFQGEQIRLVGQTGIFKPRAFTYPISIRTTAREPGEERPYDDEWIGDTLLYKYRGTDPEHWDNVAVRRAYHDNIPLIYFEGTTPGWYAASWPVYISADDPAALTFAVSAVGNAADGETSVLADRSYAHRLAKLRLHQARFRQRVLLAYDERCAICTLKRRELLDAAHIRRDTHELGFPTVSNGLSLCKLHHAAFDRNVLGIRPDLVVEIRQDILEEVDGPMLVHGLQGFQGHGLHVPRKPEWRPDEQALEERYEEFRQAG